MKCDVVMTFYRKWQEWPHVKQGLEWNRDHINRFIIVNDEPWGWDKDLYKLDGVETVQLDHPHRGWGAARCINEAVGHVGTDFFLHVDADIFLMPDSIGQSLIEAEDGLLLGCQIDDTTLDYCIEDGTLKATQFRYDERHIELREPKPLNLRHGHYLAHTETWRRLGGHDLTPPWDTEYHSMDYVLAAQWMMANGRDSFNVGGGGGYHLGGVRLSPKQSAESPENRARVRAVLDQYGAMFPDEPISWG